MILMLIYLISRASDSAGLRARCECKYYIVLYCIVVYRLRSATPAARQLFIANVAHYSNHVST